MDKGVRSDLISQKMFIKSICKSQFPHKFVNLLSISVIKEAKLTDLCGDRLLQNDFINTLSEVRPDLKLCPSGEGQLK